MCKPELIAHDCVSTVVLGRLAATCAEVLDADVAAAGHEKLDEVGVEALQGPWSTIDDGHDGSGAGGDVGGLEGDEPAADERDPPRERVRPQERGAAAPHGRAARGDVG